MLRASVQRFWLRSDDAIDAASALVLLGGDGKAQLLLQRAGHGTSRGVTLPCRGGHDLVDGGAPLPLQHLNEESLFRALSDFTFLWGLGCRRRFVCGIVLCQHELLSVLGVIALTGGAAKFKDALLDEAGNRSTISTGISFGKNQLMLWHQNK